MIHGFVRACALSPALRVADCVYNMEQTAAAMRRAAAQDVQLAVFPELGLTGYTCGDLFLQQALQKAAERALVSLLEVSAELELLTLVGLPVGIDGKLHNCAAVLFRGRLLGLVPKTYIPNYGEFYERRHFTPAPEGLRTVHFAGQDTLFGTKLLFRCKNMPEFVLAAEICEDLWSPLPPSTGHALAGATVIANLSASDEVAGKADYRRALVSQQSARLLCAYLYASAGHGESTTDMVFSAHDLIGEDGTLIAESKPFGAGCACTELDLGRVSSERCRNTSFTVSGDGYTSVEFELPLHRLDLTRRICPTPFIPAGDDACGERCELILEMQADGLAKRLEHAHAKTAVIGISGGLDSSLALLAAVRAMERLGHPASDILAITMPCFGTTHRTRSNAELLCEELKVTFREIPIANTVRSHFADIGQSEDVLDVTYENAQARVRTLELMDIANRTGGLVIGTGDLSELALGWCTYNADHMSMYGVNCGIPKTLVRWMIDSIMEYDIFRSSSDILRDILDTPISPELLPPDENGEIAQQTEDIVGPYALHDFFLYYVLRYGFEPEKIFALACRAFENDFKPDVIKKWLVTFYRRFFTQQFKRSCLPDGVKIGSICLSPRGDWRMPSDATAALWLRQAQSLEVCN